MLTITVVDRSGRENAVEAQSGISVMENLRNAGFDEILALCGGCCSCATCHVFIGEDYWIKRVGAATGDELDLLECSDHREPRSRLSCQIEMSIELNGLRVTIAPED